MKFYRNLKLSVTALLNNRSRTVFSIIGMAIGIAAVIVTVAIGEAAKEKAMVPIKAMGTNVINVNAGKFTEVLGRARSVSNVTSLSLQDYTDIKQIECIQQASAFQEAMLSVKHNTTAAKSLIQGVNTSYPDIRNYTLSSGTFFNKVQNQKSEKVAILGSQASEILFPNQNAIGKTIFINRIPFSVIGTLMPKGSEAEIGNIDNVIMVPINTLMRRVLNVDYLSKIYVQAKNMSDMGEIDNELRGLLRANHELNLYNKKDDFTIVNQANAIKTAEETNATFNYLIFGVAAVSLIIGGAGILAVMILSVRERINEIGLRISIGARKWHIVIQFLSESFMLGISGGFLGIIIGYTTATLMNTYSSWQTLVSIDSIVISFGFSIFIGLFFGVFPAMRAASFDPIKALKSD